MGLLTQEPSWSRHEHVGYTEQLESSETVRKFSVWCHCITQQIHPCLQVVPGGQFMADFPMSLATYLTVIPISPINWGLVVGLSVHSCSEFNS